MESTIWLADGFVVVTGEIGSGKTTLIESFLEELPDDVVLAHISQTQLSPVEFLQAMLVEFGFKPFRQRKVELLSMLRDYLVEQYAESRKVLLVIDEAQNLSRKVLEEVRLLSGIEAQKEKLLRIILAGQPELAAKLDSPRLEQLAQRVRLRFHLSALSNRETHEYIRHRLDVAGAEGRRIFDEEAVDEVFRYSGGVPRLTNILCDTAMLCAFAEERDTIDIGLVRAAAEELQWVEYAERRRDANSAHEYTGEYEQVSAGDVGRFDVLLRDQFVAEFHVLPGRNIIGRTPDNDLQICSKFISRHHAQVTAERGHVTIEDLNSTNGIVVRGKRVKSHELNDGDIVQLGEHKLLYRHKGFAQPVPAEDWHADEDEDVDEGAAEGERDSATGTSPETSAESSEERAGRETQTASANRAAGGADDPTLDPAEISSRLRATRRLQPQD